MANLRTNNLSGEGGRNAYNGSVYFQGYVADDTPTSYLSVPDSDDLDMGTGDFTFECWLLAVKHKGTNDPNFMGICGSTSFTAGGLLIQVNNTGPLRLAIPKSSGSLDETGGPELWGDGTSSNRNWFHIAVTRASGTLKGYVNGLQVISTTHSDAVDFAHGGSCNIGENAYATYAGDYPLRGYISNLRICKGHAVYTAEFTPPTSPLTAHYISENDKTVLLCCQDSDDPTQEATGVTITAYGGTDFSHNPDNLVKNGRFTVSATAEWTHSGGSAALGTGQSGTFGDGNHLVLTGSGGYAYLRQTITTKIGRTYLTDGQSNGGDQSFISTSTSESDAVVTDIRGGKTFIATQTTYYVILRGNDGGAGNFDTISVHEYENPTPPKVIPPYGVDAGNTFGGAISMNSSSWMYFPTGRTEERGRGRGFYMLGYFGTPSASSGKRIDYINIQSQGNSIRFGDLTVNRYTMGAGANSTRGLFTGGYQDGLSPDTDVNAIEFITIATEGNAIDFGDRVQVGRAPACASNDTRCVMASAFTPAGYQDTIDFVTIASVGNASDFGDLSTARAGMSMSCNSTTRGIFNGGYQPAPSTIRVNNMEFITFATTGNTQDFGDLTDDSQSTYGGTASSSTRGLIGLGYVHPARSNAVDFCTIATTGNASDFGDLTAAKQTYGSCSNSIRGTFLGGQTPSYINNIDMVNIATTGDATDFGDVNVGVTASGAAGSDSHGGLS